MSAESLTQSSMDGDEGEGSTSPATADLKASSTDPARARAVLTAVLVATAWAIAYGSLAPVSTWATTEVFHIAEHSRLGEAVAFFLYDVPKILLLLAGMVFVISYLRSYVNPDAARRLLAGRRQGLGNAAAAGVGVVTPFCSCSAVPLFIGFIEAGVPLGVTFSYLIAAPLVNEVAIVMLVGLFGWKTAAVYMLSGLAMATVAGIAIGNLHLEKYVEDFVWQAKVGRMDAERRLTWRDRITIARGSTREIVVKVAPFIVVGIAIGAFIHGYVPERALSHLLGEGAWWSVPAAVVLGVPLYSNAAGILPVVQALIGKGVALGVALAFMMAVVGLSLPETVILRRVLKLPLIATFVGILTVAIVATGYLFNLVL
jgi:hypothetical protein